MKYYLNDFMSSSTGATEAAVKACMALSDGDTLYLGGGRTVFESEGAFEKFYCISNNDKGEKSVAFPLIGKKSITIDGEGADLIFRGNIIPFVIDGCENVTVKGLSVDYENPSYCQADIVEADENRVLLRFGSEFPCRVEDNKFVFKGPDGDVFSEEALCLEFDKKKKAPAYANRGYFYYTGAPKDHGFLGGMYRDVVLRQCGEGLIEMKGELKRVHEPGNTWVCTFGGRDCPGILVTESKDTFLENIKLYHTLAMGVIAQLSENITLKNISADFRDGSDRVMTVKADATHFVNCRGKINISGCKFVSMMDDACNIHGIYLSSIKRVSSNVLEGVFGHHQQEGINIFRPGDLLRVIDTENQRTVAELTVDTSELQGFKVLRVTTAQPIPDIIGDCVAENISTAPEIHICDTESGNNRPRGFLLSSRGKTLIERCKFYNMFAAIHIGGEMVDWYESGAVCDVTVRDCDFDNSAYSGYVAIAIRPKIKNPENVTDFHGRIAIENNRFRMHEKRFISAASVSELIFKENSYTQDLSLPSHPFGNSNGIDIELCGKVIIEDIKE